MGSEMCIRDSVTIVDRKDYDCRAIMEQEGLDFISLFTIDDLAK